MIVDEQAADVARLVEAAQQAIELTRCVIGIDTAESERIQQARAGLIRALVHFEGAASEMNDGNGGH